MLGIAGDFGELRPITSMYRDRLGGHLLEPTRCLNPNRRFYLRKDRHSNIVIGTTSLTETRLDDSENYDTAVDDNKCTHFFIHTMECVCQSRTLFNRETRPFVDAPTRLEAQALGRNEFSENWKTCDDESHQDAAVQGFS